MENNERLLSLDFFRGLTMFLLIAGFTSVFSFLTLPQFEGTFIYRLGLQFEHHPWNGLHFWDLIQPFFMFIVGVAMPFSYAKRIKRGDSQRKVRQHFLQRSLLLLLLGWGLFCIDHGRICFYFQDVLSQLAFTVLISFLIMRKPPVTQFLVSLALLAATEIIYRTFNVPGFNQPFVPDHNFGTWLDTLYSGADLKGHWVSFNAVPTAAHTIWGVMAGQLLMSKKSKKHKVIVLVIAGLAGLIIGYGLSPVTPIIKRIATTSFVFVSGGWTLLALALSYWVIDVLKFRKGVLFFTVVGMNPLFIYILGFVGGVGVMKYVAKPFILFAIGWLGPAFSGFALSLSATLMLWYVCYWMYKNKIFIRI